MNNTLTLLDGAEVGTGPSELLPKVILACLDWHCPGTLTAADHPTANVMERVRRDSRDLARVLASIRWSQYGDERLHRRTATLTRSDYEGPGSIAGRVAHMSPGARDLFLRITSRRDSIGPVGFSIVEAIRELRERGE